MKLERQAMDNHEIRVDGFLRPELRQILDEGENIHRYQGLGLVADLIREETVKSHTLRLLPMVDKFISDSMDAFGCKKILLLHDLPEIRRLVNLGKSADTTAVEKSLSTTVDRVVESEEIEVAKAIFNDKEFDLYLGFSEAGEFLKGRTEKRPGGLFLVAKMLDEIDGSVHFHLAAFAGRLGQFLTEKAQTRAFDQYKKISKILDSLRGTELNEAAILSRRILNDGMLTIREIWLANNAKGKKIKGKIPLLIEKGLNEFVLQE